MFRPLIQRHAKFWYFRKRTGTSFSTQFAAWSFKKNISHVIFYKLTKFNCLIGFTSWEIREYVYCYYFFLVCDVINFEITVLVMIFWDFFMFYQISFSPQVKRSVIISNKGGIYELPHELPNNLRLRKLGNIRKLPKFHRII